jgi:hypothetical protein
METALERLAVPPLRTHLDTRQEGRENEGEAMMKLPEAERVAFSRMAAALDHAVNNPPSTALAIEPLEKSLFQLGYAQGATYALILITDYRLALARAMSEEAGS